MESCDKSQGHRYFDGAPGVYVHKDTTAHKADNYTNFCQIFGDGVFWAAKFEVHVDRADKVVPRQRTDQWVQRSRSVRLSALWLCGKTIGELKNGTCTSAWNGLLEAHPFKDQQKQSCIERIDYFRTFSIDFEYRINST